MTTEAQEAAKRHVFSCRHYLENALAFLQSGDAGKASEFLWGSMAQAVQSVAASRGMHLANHRSLRYFTSTVAKELGDPSIAEGFRHADRLHSNFYEVELEPQDVATIIEPIRATVLKLLDLIPPEVLEQESQGDVHV